MRITDYYDLTKDRKKREFIMKSIESDIISEAEVKFGTGKNQYVKFRIKIKLERISSYL